MLERREQGRLVTNVRQVTLPAGGQTNIPLAPNRIGITVINCSGTIVRVVPLQPPGLTRCFENVPGQTNMVEITSDKYGPMPRRSFNCNGVQNDVLVIIEVFDVEG